MNVSTTRELYIYESELAPFLVRKGMKDISDNHVLHISIGPDKTVDDSKLIMRFPFEMNDGGVRFAIAKKRNSYELEAVKQVPVDTSEDDDVFLEYADTCMLFMFTLIDKDDVDLKEV